MPDTRGDAADTAGAVSSMVMTQKTEQFYRKVVRRFASWVAAEIEAGRADSPDLWVDAMRHFASQRSYATWRLYRAAVSWHLMAEHGRRFADDFEQGAVAVEDKPGANRKRRLVKHIPPEILSRLIARLREDGRKQDGFWVANLLMATVATGIRPNEWHQTTRIEGNLLRVVNAKYSAGSALKAPRANGRVRDLILEPEVIGSDFDRAITATLEWMNGKPWLQVQARANRIFKTALRSLISRREIGTRWGNLRIYDARHQFSADAKANLDLFSGEVAAAMGHGSGMTAVVSYGGKRHASGGKSAVRPSAASVSAVRQETLTELRAATDYSLEWKRAAEIRHNVEGVGDGLDRERDAGDDVTLDVSHRMT